MSGMKSLDKNHYQDSHVEILSDQIIIKMYYFPFGSKTIKFEDIECVRSSEELALSHWGWKTWGMGFSMIWWACHNARAFSDKSTQFVIKVKGTKLKCGFSVENPDAIRGRLSEFFAAPMAQAH